MKIKNLFFSNEVGGRTDTPDGAESTNIPVIPLNNFPDSATEDDVLTQALDSATRNDARHDFDMLTLDTAEAVGDVTAQTNLDLNNLLSDIIKDSDTIMQAMQDPSFSALSGRVQQSGFGLNTASNTANFQNSSPAKLSNSLNFSSNPELQKQQIIQKLTDLRQNSRNLYFSKNAFNSSSKIDSLISQANSMQSDYDQINQILNSNPSLANTIKSNPILAKNLSAIPANLKLIRDYANKISNGLTIAPRSSNLSDRYQFSVDSVDIKSQTTKLVSQINDINTQSKLFYNQFLAGKISKPQLEAKFKIFQSQLENDIIKNQLNKNPALKTAVLTSNIGDGKKIIDQISGIRLTLGAMLKPITYGNKVDNERQPGMKSNAELLALGKIGAINSVLNYMREQGNCPYDNNSFKNLANINGQFQGECVNFVRKFCHLNSYGFNLPGNNVDYASKKVSAVQNYGESPIPVAGSIIVMPCVLKGHNYGHIGVCIGPGDAPGTYKVAQSNWLHHHQVVIHDFKYVPGNTDPNANYIAHASRALGRPNPNDIRDLIKANQNPYKTKAGPYT